MVGLEKYSGMVVNHSTLLSILKDYQAPNFKIHSLLKEGVLIGLKKGLYAVASASKNQLISLPLVANHLYGPSYVSLEYALSFYGIIPERVVVVTSVCTKRGKVFNTPLAAFSYQHLPADYYSIGINSFKETERVSYLIASPEKALVDWLALTPNLKFYSAKSLATLLFEDMRMDEEILRAMDLGLINSLAKTGFRNNRLKFIAELIGGLQC